MARVMDPDQFKRLLESIRQAANAAPPTLAEALAQPNPDSRRRDFVAYVGAKELAHGWDALTALEQTAILADRYWYKLQDGGLSSTILWDPPEYRDEAIAALERIGAHATAAVLRRAAAAL